MKIAPPSSFAVRAALGFSFACLLATGLPPAPAAAVTGDYSEFALDTGTSGPTEIADFGGDVLWTSLSAIGKLAKISLDGKATVVAPAGMTATSFPSGLALGGDKRIWIAEKTGNRIGALDPTSGAYAGFALPNAASAPTALAAAADGSVWFTESTGNRIGRIDNSGRISEFELAANSGPLDIVLGSDGAMWFTMSVGNAIGRITPNGVSTTFSLPRAASGPEGIALGPDGNAWFTERSGNRIGRITPAGVITEFDLASPSSAPVSIAALPDGHMWFTEGGASRVGRISMSGTIVEYTMPQSVRPSVIAAGSDGNAWLTLTASGKAARLLTGIVPLNLTAPAVTPASVAAGGVLSATSGSWKYSPVSYAYQWQRCTTSTPAVCTDIPSATKNTYTSVTADAGQRVQALISATNLNGVSTKSVASNVTSVTAASPTPTPSPTPSVKPTAVTGQRSVQIGSGVTATIIKPSTARRGRYQAFTLQMSNSSVRGKVRMSIITGAGAARVVVAPGKWVNAAGTANKVKRIPYSLPKGMYTLQMIYTPVSQQEYLYSAATISIPLRIR